MTKAPITTERLSLRAYAPEDSGWITAALQDPGIVQMLPYLPWPYTLADARRFVVDVAMQQALSFVVEDAQGPVGTISAEGQLGYWLTRPAWGQGYATEAARALVPHRFARSGQDLASCHRLGNSASRNVLVKLGLKDTTTRPAICPIDGAPITMQDMELPFASWSGT